MWQLTRLAVMALILSAAFGSAAGETVTRTILFEHEGTVLEGFLAYDEAGPDQRPGVLIVHQWMGPTENERMRARQLAGLGYVALATDVYGRDVRPADAKEAGEQAGKFRSDRALFRERLSAGLTELKAHPLVDPRQVVAIGYCFGGGGVLELARSGAELAGVVSFHGNLDTPDPADAEAIKAKIMVCHGAADPHVSRESLLGFIDEMEAAAVDYQLIMYAGAVHAFTQREAGDDPSRGAAYHAAADRRSWNHMRLFFDEILAPDPGR